MVPQIDRAFGASYHEGVPLMETTLNGVRHYYYSVGPDTGCPILFLHGFPFNSDMWTPQIRRFSDHTRCIAYDIRGHGRTDIGDTHYTLEFFVDDLVALLDFLHVQQAIVCGLSMGGYIALRAIERYPQRVCGLVLCDTRSEGDSNEAKVKRSEAIQRLKADLTQFTDGFLKTALAEATFQNQPSVVEQIRNMILLNAPPAMAGTLLALAARTDTTAILPRIQVPTLVLVGAEDRITPPEVAQRMSTQIPNAKLQVIPNAGHLSNLENPAVFNTALASFLQTANPLKIKP